MDKTTKYKWTKTDTILLLWTIIPLVIGIALSFWHLVVGMLWVGFAIGIGVGTGNGRQAMIAWMKELGLKVEGKIGREKITIYKPKEEENK